MPPLNAEDHVCPDCGLDYSTIGPQDAIAAIRSWPRRYRSVFGALEDDETEGPDALLRRRPDERTWSALEYLCHMRDVFELYDGRVRRALVEDDPLVQPMGADARAEAERYNEQDLGAVLDAFTNNAERLAATLSEVRGDQWARTATREPDDSRTVLWMARQTTHEGRHHLRDIERVLAGVRGR